MQGLREGEGGTESILDRWAVIDGVISIGRWLVSKTTGVKLNYASTVGSKP
jgi:hypothetical protein